MSSGSFQDLRLSNREMPMRGGGQFQPYADFVAFVRGDDGRLRRFPVMAVSRFIAAKDAENCLQVRERLRGRTVSVLRLFDPSQPSPVGDECQSPCEFTILMQGASGIRETIAVWEIDRHQAVETAVRRTHGGRPIRGQIRFPSLGPCGYCRVTLFTDMKIRETPRGLKCADCD